jgi:hypothetical protein
MENLYGQHIPQGDQIVHLPAQETPNARLPWEFVYNRDNASFTSVVIPSNIESFANCSMSLCLWAALRNVNVENWYESTDPLSEDEAVPETSKRACYYFLGAATALKDGMTPIYRQFSGVLGQGFRYAGIRSYLNQYPKYGPYFRSVGIRPEEALYGNAWATTASPAKRRMLALFRKLCDIIEIDYFAAETWMMPTSALNGTVWSKNVGFNGSGFLSSTEMEVLRKHHSTAYDSWVEWCKERDRDYDRLELVSIYDELRLKWVAAAAEINQIIGIRANSLSKLSKAQRRQLQKSQLNMKIAVLDRKTFFEAFSPLRLISIRSGYSESLDDETDEHCVTRNVENLANMVERSTVAADVKLALNDCVLSFASNLGAHEEI